MVRPVDSHLVDRLDRLAAGW